MNVSELLVAALEKQGVRFVFGLPGDENLPFVEAVRESPQMQFVLVRHEAAAGFMAAAHGYQTGQLAVAMGTLGAGASNLVTATGHAWLAEHPMLVITGQKPVLDNRQGRYQLLDIVNIMRPITKSAASIGSPHALPGLVAEAISSALSFPQGPAHLELPVDVASLDASDVTLLGMTAPDPVVAAPATLDQAADRIRSAERPLVLLGSAANTRHSVPAAFRSFIDATGLPFIATMMGKGVGDEHGESFVGTAGMPAMGIPHCAVQHADLVVSLGHNVMEKAPFIMTEDGADVIHVHEFPAVADTIWFPQLQVLGDMGHTLDQLTQRLADATWDLSGFRKMNKVMNMAITQGSDDYSSPPVKPQVVAAAVRSVLGPQDILSLDNGIHKLWMTRNYPTAHPRTVMVDSALGSMGPGVPAAIAAKLVHPQRRVCAVVGDGGFLMTGQEIETAVRLGLDLVVIVFNDAGLGMIRLKQTMEGLENHGVDFGNPDLRLLAQAYGATGHRVEDASAVRSVLEQAYADGGVHLIDIPVDYGENPKLLMAMKTINCEAILGG